jgi:membrane protein YqaA with SNARE-associated domain
MKKILNAPLRLTRWLYDWVLSWSNSRYSLPALFLLSMAEASFFPIAPDVLLIALCMGTYLKWKRFALVCSIGSIVGDILGFLIGQFAFDLIGEKLVAFTASISGTEPEALLEQARYWFIEKELYGMKVGVWAVGIAGFTPIPYKVFTISAGFFDMPFVPFVIASAVSRSLRFFIVAGLIGLLYEKYGHKIQEFIDKYFNWLALAFVILLVGGFMALRLF